MRRSARCLNRLRAPTYAEREEPKQSAGRRGRPKKKRNEENLDPVTEAQVAAKVARKTVKAEPKERKPCELLPPSAAPSSPWRC